MPESPRSWLELDTPVPLVDVERLDQNLRDMAQVAAASDVRQRPHTKSHKTREIALRQLELGASGITVAKVGEAEAMASAGFSDILIAYPIVGHHKYERILKVMELAEVKFAVDSVEAATDASHFFAGAGRTAGVLLEHDGGAGRSGVQSVEEALALAKRIDSLPGLRMDGVMSYGNAYRTTDPEEQAQIGWLEGANAVGIAETIREAGIDAAIVSVGSTPTARHVVKVPGVTELRAGVYAFHDLKQHSLGVATLDQCALTVLVTVVSHPRKDRYVIDAGIKALAGEDYGWGTYGRVVERPDLVLTGATEEHGIITLPSDGSDPRWPIGQRLRIIPNHACGCVNMHDRLIAVEGEIIVDTWSVIGRGRVQ